MELTIKKFKNIYGIKNLTGISNINSNALIYAPNGGTKTSFTLGLDAISKSGLPKDRIYNKDGEYEFEFDGKVYKNTNPKMIDNIVVYNYDKYLGNSIELQSYDLGLLTISNDLKIKYGKIYNSVLDRIDILSARIANKLGNKKKVQDNIEIVLDFFKNYFEINSWKDVIRFLSKLNWEETISLEYSFFEVFNDNTLPIIGSTDFTRDVEVLNKTINSKIVSNLFSGSFGSIQASKLLKELSTDGFFEAGHALKINNIDELVDSVEKFQRIYDDEKKKIYEDENTQKVVEGLLSKINKNKSTKAIKKYISNPEILIQMEDIQSFIIKTLAGILDVFKEEIISVNNQIIESDASIKKLIEESNNQKTKWESICETFNERFDVPFKINIKNKFNSMVGSNNPEFVFVFNGHSGDKETDEDQLREVLSTGEKRALTILSFLFDLNTSIEQNNNTFIILDDIVDSFDYKNKYAMIEYISELSDKNNIMCWILTHNFDFFTNCNYRLKNYGKFYIRKNINSENFIKFNGNVADGGMKLFANWKTQLTEDFSEQKFLALIPVARNLIELKYGKDDEKYVTLCNALHYRENTDSLTVSDLAPIFKEVFDINLQLDNNKSIISILNSNVESLLSNNTDNKIELDEKLIVSIAIRLLLERIFNKIDSSLSNNNLTLGEEYNRVKNIIKDEDRKTITKAIISIPEFIHLNSFMYEPLIDIPINTLKKIYRDIERFRNNY